MKSSIKTIFLQLTKFGLVGVCNTLITLGTIFLLMKIGRVHYIPANIVGYILGFLNSFILNKIWTFRSKSGFFVEFRRFFLIFAVSYLLQLGFLIIIREKVGIRADLAQVISMVFYTLINFCGNKFYTFRK